MESNLNPAEFIVWALNQVLFSHIYIYLHMKFAIILKILLWLKFQSSIGTMSKPPATTFSLFLLPVFFICCKINFIVTLIPRKGKQELDTQKTPHAEEYIKLYFKFLKNKEKPRAMKSKDKEYHSLLCDHFIMCLNKVWLIYQVWVYVARLLCQNILTNFFD